MRALRDPIPRRQWATRTSGCGRPPRKRPASDRFEAFVPDLFAVDVAGRYIGALSDVAYMSGRIGAVADVPMEAGDPELFLLYGAKTWIESRGLSAGLGLSGRYLVSESDWSAPRG